MLPKPLYEPLPYLYLAAGAGILLAFDGAATPVGLILFFFGAWFWVMRSERRRKNSRRPLKRLHKRHWSPVIYELQPFLYLFVAILIFDYLSHPVRYVFGPLLLFFGIGILIVRTVNRRQAPPAPKKPRFVPERGAVPELSSAPEEPRSLAGARVPVVEVSPGAPQCKRCVVLDICQTVQLEDASIREVMRLSQTVSHEHAYDLFHQAVERCEGRQIREQELRPVLDKLGAYAHLCATWRDTGRHA
ncbi:hypothetical protein [Motiliproteus sp. SC1-56]|uniref:hypothetical protein n=1 Tax=Motiliproteus sp. SC1-56 TaxID=2799565 RepID=UPI001A8F9B91|nr:hypothetical protein [Motiliproteus sp. SC1-56]